MKIKCFERTVEIEASQADLQASRTLSESFYSFLQRLTESYAPEPADTEESDEGDDDSDG